MPLCPNTTKKFKSKYHYALRSTLKIISKIYLFDVEKNRGAWRRPKGDWS